MPRLSLLVIGAALAAAAPAKTPPATGGNVVVSVSGAALQAAGKRLKGGSPIPAGVKLELGKGGRAVLRLGDAGVVELEGPASFVLGKEPGFRLDAGRALSVLKRLAGPFSVTTAHVVASVRGTEFFVEARGEGGTYLCLCSGALEVAARGGGFKTALTAAHHAAYLFAPKREGMTQATAPMEQHSDAQLEALRKLLR